jgi:hypothetical protein
LSRISHTNKEDAMISQNPNESSLQDIPRSEAKAGAAEVPVLNPRSPIEVASGGTGPINDPGASDTRPPGVTEYELFV